MSVRATKRVRELLVELDTAFERFDNSVRAIVSAGPDTSLDHQIEKGSAEREIIGLAYQIREASRAKK